MRRRDTRVPPAHERGTGDGDNEHRHDERGLPSANPNDACVACVELYLIAPVRAGGDQSRFHDLQAGPDRGTADSPIRDHPTAQITRGGDFGLTARKAHARAWRLHSTALENARRRPRARGANGAAPSAATRGEAMSWF